MITPSNVFENVPDNLPEELCTILVESPAVRIERIVSHSHASPEGFWYDQPWHEWVMVLKGHARLRFERDNQPVTLKQGDAVNIPAHTRHRVDWTTPDEPTVWLAIHYGD